jgi:glutamate synthase (NADPH/NADH) small chain
MSHRIKMPQRNPQIRKKDFKQVSIGYTKEEMLLEAKRCLQCETPMCVKGCPAEINIPGFIKCLLEDRPKAAIEVLNQKTSLPAVCGRVCPQENQCEKNCVLSMKKESIAIGNLERYSADVTANDKDENICIEKNNVKIAVIGSGPAGLTCGGDLLKQGYDVTVFESLHDTGGVLRYGIPEFRLPKEVLDVEINKLKNLGMKFVLNTLIGRTKTIQDLFEEGFKAIFVAVGAGLPIFPNLPGENLNHIYCANEFLVRVNLMRSYNFPNYDTPVYIGENVVVVGGGNTAMDSARTAIRLGAETVKLIYRRSENEMPARVEERIHAKEEGIEFVTLTNPIKFIGDEKGFVEAVECVKVELREPDKSGRKKPKALEGSNYILETDMIILALGLNPNPILASLTRALKTDSKGHILCDETCMTSIPGVFAGGDIVGSDTVIAAMGMGQQAAKNIIHYLTK